MGTVQLGTTCATTHPQPSWRSVVGARIFRRLTGIGLQINLGFSTIAGYVTADRDNSSAILRFRDNLAQH